MQQTINEQDDNGRNSRYNLKAAFTRCPICGGTTSLDLKQFYYFCYSCGSKWDFSYRCFYRGDIQQLPLIRNTERRI